MLVFAKFIPCWNAKTPVKARSLRQARAAQDLTFQIRVPHLFTNGDGENVFTLEDSSTNSTWIVGSLDLYRGFMRICWCFIFFYPASPTKNCMVGCLISDSAQIHRLIPSGFTHPNLSAWSEFLCSYLYRFLAQILNVWSIYLHLPL